MITIDGSRGEGGGQILRTALALALVTGQPFRIDHIRAGRTKPGLLRQHLTAVQAAARIGQATVTGATMGSLQLTFEPGPVTPGMYSFSVGTAGSTTLVLQTVLPALLCATGPSTLTLEGGTHNPFAPPFDFLEQAFLPLVNRLGAQVHAVLERPGFFPAGGGKWQVTIHPTATLRYFDLLTRGAIQTRRARAVVANLPPSIAQRELQVVHAMLGWPETCLHVEVVTTSRGPGNIVTLEIVCDYVTEVFTGFGERSVRAERVAELAVKAARHYLAEDIAVGEYLADQLLIPLALAGGGSFTTLPLSRHATTNIAIIEQFLPLHIAVTPGATRAWRVTIET